MVDLQASPTLELSKPTTLILAAVHVCYNPQTKGENGIYYYSRDGHLEVVDITCIQCLVRRMKDGNEWAIVDRSDSAVRPMFVTEK